MKGDFSRQTFDRRRHYASVLMQQGRVQVDADWNEQQAIGRHLDETRARDVIGLCGGPKDNAGFGLTIENVDGQQNLFVGAGRYYVDGILCEIEQRVASGNQPDLPGGQDILAQLDDASWAIVFLDVWRRHITALDEKLIRETALGGPDTSTRAKTVWQVRALPLRPTRPIDCQSKLSEWDELVAPSGALMNARTKLVPETDDVCIIPPEAGYRRLENQLYRVEVHEPGGPRLFKWSRDNGAVVTSIEKFDGQSLTVSDTGRDDVLGFNSGQWVEVVDDRSELNGEPGQLHRIDTVDANSREIILKDVADAIPSQFHPKLRRWDGVADGNLALPTAWIELEGGIEVQFDGQQFRSGDYWLIPARTATGQIEWPSDENPNLNPQQQPPIGIEHHYCRLGMLQKTQNGWTVADCRDLFPPLTQLDSPVGPIDRIRIERVTLRTLGQADLENDATIAAAVLVGGIAIHFDDKLAVEAVINKPVCDVTLDVPWPLFSNPDVLPEDGTILGFQPVRLTAKVDVVGKTIFWRPVDLTSAWLAPSGNSQSKSITDLFQHTKRNLPDWDGRLLAHLRLKGNFIRAAGQPLRFLDGDSFGISADGQTKLALPSGDNYPGGDFEMWFWLKEQLLKSITFADDEVTGSASIRGTVTLTQVAPPEGVDVKLSISPTSPQGVVRSLPVSVRVAAGRTSEQFRMTVQAPEPNQKKRIQVIASHDGIQKHVFIDVLGSQL